jgi:hypothetical protein
MCFITFWNVTFSCHKIRNTILGLAFFLKHNDYTRNTKHYSLFFLENIRTNKLLKVAHYNIIWILVCLYLRNKTMNCPNISFKKAYSFVYAHVSDFCHIHIQIICNHNAMILTIKERIEKLKKQCTFTMTSLTMMGSKLIPQNFIP